MAMARIYTRDRDDGYRAIAIPRSGSINGLVEGEANGGL